MAKANVDTVWRRIVARLIDLLILQLFIFFPMEYAFKTISPEVATFFEERANPLAELRSPSSYDENREERPSREVGFILFVYSVLTISVMFLYRLLFHHFLRATIGKMLMGVRLVSLDSAQLKPSWKQVLKREGLDATIGTFIGPGFYASTFLSKRRRHLGDVFAETVVIGRPATDQTGNKEELSLSPVFFFLGLLAGFLAMILNCLIIYGHIKLLS